MSLIHTHHVPLVPLFQVHDPMIVCPHWLGGGGSFFKKNFLITEVLKKYTIKCTAFKCSFVIKPKFVCLVHSEPKQNENARVCSREWFIARAKQGE